MKILHLSDLHIGKRVLEYSMLEDQKYILDKILEIISVEQPDAIIIAGDVYDKCVPSAEAVSLFDSFLTKAVKLCKHIFIISGNHDSSERLSFASELMRDSGVYISPVYTGEITPIRLYDDYGAIDFYLIPFLKPPMVRRFFEDVDTDSYNAALKAVISSLNIDKSVRNVAVAHQFITGAERSDSEEATTVGGIEDVDASLFDLFDYTALGHIHRPQKIACEKLRYSGTPLKYSASEAEHKKSVCIAELGEKGALSVRLIPLVPLRDMRILKASYNELMKRENYLGTNTEDYIHIILSDESEIPNALGKLRSVYPNIMSLKYSALRFSENESTHKLTADTKKSPNELFAELYEAMNNTKMSKEQVDILSDICEEIIDEGGFEK